MDNRSSLFPHVKSNPFTERRGKYISVSLHKYLDSIIQQESQRNNNYYENLIQDSQKLTDLEITN